MKIMSRLVILSIVAAMMAGCASNAELSHEVRARVDASIAKLNATEPCCQDLSALDYRVVTQEPIEFSIDSAHARLFDQGKSHFLALKLPRAEGPMTVAIKPREIRSGTHALSSLFDPSVLILDDDFHVVKTLVDLPLCHSQGWSSSKTGYFASLNLDLRTQRYLVFYTTSSALSGHERFQNSATSAGGGAVVTVNVDYEFPHSPDGALSVWLADREMIDYLTERCARTMVTP